MPAVYCDKSVSCYLQRTSFRLESGGQIGNQWLPFKDLRTRSPEIIAKGFIPSAQVLVKESLSYSKQRDPILFPLIVVSFIRIENIGHGLLVSFHLCDEII